MKIQKQYFICLFILINNTIHAQDLTNNLKVWSGISMSYSVNKNLKVKLAQLFAFNVSSFNYSFSQTKIALSHKIYKKTYIEGGFVRGLFKASNSLKRQGATSGWFNTRAVDRVYGNLSFKHRLLKRLSIKHKIEFQHFFPNLKKYKTRSIYSNRISYNVRKSSLTPYLEGQLYYYKGGVISNGIKRFRFKSGLSFKPFKNSSTKLSLYYLYQNESDTNPLSDNDYTVFGTNISFKIN